jgi:hypothetical protein
MVLLFWVCAILLALSVIGGLWYPQARAAAIVLVAIDIIILGAKVFGLPH